MPIDLPRSTRLASPSFDGTNRWLLVLGAVSGGGALLLIPTVGWMVAALCMSGGWFAARRRRSLGAYEGVDGLVVRNWFVTHLVPWSTVDRVEQRRDPWLPFLRVAVLRHGEGETLPISGLRHSPSSTPAPVLTVTKLVRDKREERSRERWTF